MIEDFFTTLFTVNRSAWTTDGEGNPYSTESEGETFYGHIQQANAELVQHLGLSLTKAFSVWCARDTDVKAGDTIATNGTTYSVRAVQDNATGDSEHFELIVESDDE